MALVGNLGVFWALWGGGVVFGVRFVVWVFGGGRFGAFFDSLRRVPPAVGVWVVALVPAVRRSAFLGWLVLVVVVMA